MHTGTLSPRRIDVSFVLIPHALALTLAVAVASLADPPASTADAPSSRPAADANAPATSPARRRGVL